MRLVTICIATTLFLSGCGKYGNPIAPEALSPAAVGELSASADPNGVQMVWVAPENDRRGQELKFIDGYRVYRKNIDLSSGLLNQEQEYELLNTVTDAHILERDKLRAVALEKGTPIRKAKVDPAMKRFSFRDSALAEGNTYLYKIVPINQGGLEGVSNKLVQVLYRGENSEVRLLSAGEEFDLPVLGEELP